MAPKSKRSKAAAKEEEKEVEKSKVGRSKRKVDHEENEMKDERTARGKKRKTEPVVKEEEVSAPPAKEVFTRWLIKSEPETRIEKGVDMRFSFEDLKQEKDSTACWDGVRNYQARNFMRTMKVSFLFFLEVFLLYHRQFCFIIQRCGSGSIFFRNLLFFYYIRIFIFLMRIPDSCQNSSTSLQLLLYFY